MMAKVAQEIVQEMTQGRGRGLRWLPALLWAAMIYRLSSSPHHPDLGLQFMGLDKIAHLSVFAVLAALLWLAPGLHGAKLRVWGIASLYGVLDEWHQSWVPGRACDPWDGLADMVGAGLGVWLICAAETRWHRWLAARRASDNRQASLLLK